MLFALMMQKAFNSMVQSCPAEGKLSLPCKVATVFSKSNGYLLVTTKSLDVEE